MNVFQKSIPLLQRAVANRPQDTSRMKELAASFSMRGEYWLQQWKSQLALDDVHRALEINEMRLSITPENRDVVDLIIEGYKSKGILLRRTGLPDEAAAAYLKGIELIEELEAGGIASRETLRSKAGITNNLAYLYQNQGEYEKSLKPYEDAARLYGELAEGDVVRIETYLQASSLTNKGAALAQLDRVPDAMVCFDAAIAQLETAKVARPDNRMLMQFLFEAYVYRSDQLDKTRRYAEAQDDLEAAIELDENRFADLAGLKLLAVNVALGDLNTSIDAAAKLAEGKPSDYWAEASRVASRAAVVTLDNASLSEEERAEETHRYASLAASHIQQAMKLDQFQLINSSVIPNIPEHKRLWDRPEYDDVRQLFSK